MRTLTSGTVVSGVEVPLPQAARTNVAATAAVIARIRDILIIDMVLPPGNWRKKRNQIKIMEKIEKEEKKRYENGEIRENREIKSEKLEKL